MYRRSKLMNEYWMDKRADIESINIPTYVVASYSSFVHTMGSVRGWLDVDTPHKWLRWDPFQEWFDLWSVKESVDELAAFFDHFLKGTSNGWEKTPHVRMASLNFGDREPVYPIEVPDFPIPNTNYRTMYLGPNNKLAFEAPEESIQVS